MFALMLFMFLFFLGFLVMFIYLLGKLNRQSKALSDEHAQLRVLLRAMESRLDKMAQMERLNAVLQGKLDSDAILPGESANEDDSAGHDPLLHLSFEKPRNIAGDVDPGLSLDLEPGSWNLGVPQKDQA